MLTVIVDSKIWISALLVILVEPTYLPSISRDLKDDVFLACALESHADFIVTGDDDLIVLGEYHGTKIVTVSSFLDILTAATS